MKDSMLGYPVKSLLATATSALTTVLKPSTNEFTQDEREDRPPDRDDVDELSHVALRAARR